MCGSQYKIISEFGCISIDSDADMQIEVNVVSWDDGKPGIDVREWSRDRKNVGSGINLSKEAYENLKKLIVVIDESIENLIKDHQRNNQGTRKTYYLTGGQVRAIALMSANENRTKTEIVRAALEHYIPDRYFR